ncbi:MAG TPA: shikimate kinase [Elusimicrobia bacterium]|jgi:shikimate kinase|nr:shikimate kinase [Elusimicrobiota bacterium]
MNIVLTGFMGSGKTVIGKELARKLKRKFVDTDGLIEKKSGLKIYQIFSSSGEPHFRRLESETIEKVTKEENLVIAVGGGAVLKDENMKNLEKNGIIINLKVKPEIVFARIKKDSVIRPLLQTADPLTRIKELLKQREPYYARCNFVFDVSELSVEETVEKIIQFLKKDT